jgi:diguanylate cyclase (GGDEF)-like protein
MTAFVILAAIGWLTASIVAHYWWHQASYDQLTGLPNRGRLETRAMWARRRRRATVGLLLLDVDRFKQINDTFGHRAGDELLASFADRLRQATHRREVAVRLHGDEFAVWLGAVGPAAAARRADEVAAQLARPVQVAGVELVMTASVGHATAGRVRSGTLADLLHQADASMYSAKRSRPALPSLPVPAPASRLRDRGKDVA